jgi:hypothetical protein
MDLSKFDKEVLQNFFEKVIGKSLNLTITDNSSTMISYKKKGTRVSLRIHKMFQHAEPDVLYEVAQFVMDKKKTTPLIKKFIDNNKDKIKESTPQKVTIISKGRYYDLQKIFDSLNKQYFNSRITTSVTWGKRRRCSGTQKVTLGSYNRDKNMIRINPILDKIIIPAYFVEFIVYHEMLHADIGIGERKGRRVIHSPEFKQRERLFTYYYEAVAWEKENIHLF